MPSNSFVQAGDNVGLLLRGLKRGDVERGQVSVPNFKVNL
jgi:translation elongation factor EF-Tu-like GTPase